MDRKRLAGSRLSQWSHSGGVSVLFRC